MGANFSVEVFDLDQARTNYDTIETQRPDKNNLVVDNFLEGDHFRTASDEAGALVLQLEDRLLTIILDESGSMTWNDNNGDRYIYLRRLLTKLRDTYPGTVTANLIGFGGVPVKTKLLVTKAEGDFLSDPSNQQLSNLLQQTFQDSVHDFAGVRVVRRTDRFPAHPADGVVLEEGIIDAVKDENLIEGQRYFYGVWTFNKNLHFSQGQFVSGVPFDRILPLGVNFASATPRILPGLIVDDNTQILYNLIEGSGQIAFDSSGNARHAITGSQVLEENFWLGDAAASSTEQTGSLKKPVGVRFDGIFDLLEADVDAEVGASVVEARNITINLWVYRYSSSTESWIIGTSQPQTTSDIGWAITINASGEVGLKQDSINDGTEVWSGVAVQNFIPLETWTMVTAVIDAVDGTHDLYINGTLIDNITIFNLDIETDNKTKLYIGGFPTDSGVTWSGGDYFGSLANISIHNNAKTLPWVTNTFATETFIFDQPLQGASETPADNTQREVLISWEIEEDFDFAGGQIKILRKYREVPKHDADGTIVLTQAAISGQFFFLDVFDFINNQDYYYRIFTVNSIGNSSDRVDARVLPVHIPVTPAQLLGTSLSPVTEALVTDGNHKIMLQWANPIDSSWRGTRVYFGAEKFPTVSTNSQGELEVSDGFEIFDTLSTSFVHRKTGINSDGIAISLENGKFHFYTIIAYDRLGGLSTPATAVGTPSSSLATIFPPEEVKDLHLEVINPTVLSIQWISPIVRSDTLELFFGEAALIFVNIRDIFGGDLDDLVNITLQVCTDITDRDLTTREQVLGILGPGDALDGPCGGGASAAPLINGGCQHGAKLEENCNDEKETAETVLEFSVVEDGLIKGLLTHTPDTTILTRRERYEMSVRAQYRVTDPITDELLFELNTEPVSVSFQHPLDIALVNKLNKEIRVPCGDTGEIRGETICPNANCSSGAGASTGCSPPTVNGTHINAVQPYVVRVELQFKGEALPDGTTINASLFKSNENQLTEKSSRTSMREGAYVTSSVLQPLLNSSGRPTGEVVNKSIVDIEILAPSLPDKVDLYVSIDFLGFFVDSIHTIQFVGSLFIEVSPTKPLANGIDIAEQFAIIETLDPNDPSQRIPVADGTLVKWELVKLRFAKDRPFYSTEPINELISGIFSTTTGGIARNIFFGPISNIMSHSDEGCNNDCCIGEEYAVKASVILGDETATDGVFIAYPCIEDEETFQSKRLFMNAAPGQTGQTPNYITWGDGISLLKFGIARDPNSITDDQLPQATCFRSCIGGQLLSFPEGHIVQVTAQAEILWDVIFGGAIDSGTIEMSTSVIEGGNSSTATLDIIPPGNLDWDDDPTFFNLGHFNSGGLESTIDMYLRLQVNIPVNHVIQSAKIVMTSQSQATIGNRADLDITILDNSGAKNSTLKDANETIILGLSALDNLKPIQWTPDGTTGAGFWPVAGESNEESTTTDLTPFLQAFIDQGSYASGDYAIFKIEDNRAAGVETAWVQIENITGTPPALVIESAPKLAAGNNILSSSSISPAEGEQSVTAAIPISGDVTDFYLRKNTFIGENKNPQPDDCSQGGSGGGGGSGATLLSCEWENECFDFANCSPVAGIRWVNVSPVSGVSTLMSDNISISLQGGGGYGLGVPPILVGFKEPLSVAILETRVNGVRLDFQELDVSGVNQHTFVVEITFGADENNSPKPVPDGTPVELTVTGADANLVILSNCSQGLPGCSIAQSGKVFTTQVNDPFINPTGAKRSLAYFSINPLPNVPFNAKINVTSRYDELGTSEREITKCIELNNTINVSPPIPPPPGQAPEPPPPTVASNEAIIYNTIQDVYRIKKGGNLNRIAHFHASGIKPEGYEYGYRIGASNRIYSFGGFTDHDLNGFAQITPTSERFDLVDDEWQFVTNMPTARAAGMTATSGDAIYCIGGLELNPITQQYAVSRKIESFDTISEQWNSTLSPMPEDNGIAFGDAQAIGNFIYVTCGVTSVINNNQPDEMNERVLRYSISEDRWDEIVPSNIDIYKRISPFGFYRSNPLPQFVSDKARYYIYGGSIPKSNAEINAEFSEKFNQQLNDFRSFILTSPYYLSLTESEQASFIAEEEEKIQNNIVIPPFIYPSTGFKFRPGSEIEDSSGLSLDISDQLDNEWPTLPLPRDRGEAVYIPTQDAVYFMGGANQNKSTTLNKVEVIDLANDENTYTALTAFSRGRSLFGSVAILDDIYLSGGLTSGHAEGYVEIDLVQGPSFIEARGSQSSGVLIFLRDDAGELVSGDIRCIVRGRLRVESIDRVLSQFLADRAADRALGGDGRGNAPDTPQPGDEIDVGQLIEAQNQIIDPNSDQFQFNAAKKLDEEVFLFPVLYSEQEIIISGGVGGVTLLPRSEDPLSDLEKLSQFITETLSSTPPDPNEKFEGDLTREELIALGDALKTVQLPPTILDSNTNRNLYEIETIVTIVDDTLFGQTVSDFDLNIQELIDQKIVEILTPPEEPEEEDIEGTGGTGGTTFGGIPVSESGCFLVQHVATPEIPGADQPPPPAQSAPNNPGGTGGFNQSGQCLFCTALLPLNPQIKLQLPTSIATFFNFLDWVPQIKERLTGGHSLTDTLVELDIVDHEVPFGASQLYTAIQRGSITSTGESFESLKKVFYITSDNSENYSLITRTDAIDEVNAIDGDRNTPVVYTVFSTSFPVSLAAELERNEFGDIEKITQATGGQSSTLISSGFMDQILNLTIGGATGGLGWGKYTKLLDFGELSAITDITSNFNLPLNTQGFFRFRHSVDGFNFTDFTERFKGSQSIDFVDFFAQLLEFEIILTTGFTVSISEEYDATATGIPKLISLTWGTSAEKEDFLFLNKEDVLTNAAQVAMSFEGTVPNASFVEIGVASSNSHNWRDFQSAARPAISEFGKIILLERTDRPNSIVPIEPLTTRDGLLFTTTYGPWDSTSTASLFKIDNTGQNLPIFQGFRFHPHQGQIYFDQRQPLNTVFKLAIVNDDCMRVGLRLRNRLHTDSISIEGLGYIYSTNDIKPSELSQVAPRAINVFVTPTNPTTQSTFIATYTYVDLNGDPESGTVISWFRNGTQLVEIQNRITWTTSDLNANNKLEPNDKVWFSVTPSDGRDFGSTVFAPSVSIIAQPPAAEELTVLAIRNDLVNARFDTGSTFKVEYNFQIEDAGSQAIENGTIIRWFVNNAEFQVGEFAALTPPENDAADPRILLPVSESHQIGNSVFVSVTPKTTLVTGTTQISNIFEIVNSIAIISEVKITPELPTSSSQLVLNYKIDDPDLLDAANTQEDQSEIRWFFSIDGGLTFTQVTQLFGQTSVAFEFLTAGNQWKTQVTPFDGLDFGAPVESNIVTISSP